MAAACDEKSRPDRKKYATCECGRVMEPGSSCALTHAENAKGERVLRKAERFREGDCGDCNVALGKPHHTGCDNERCAFCPDQAIGCEHAVAYIAFEAAR
jgi:hypothetical protein